VAINRVQLDKDTPEGYEAGLDTNQDALDARGVYLQNDTSDDTQVLLTRDANSNMTFQDAFNAPITLSRLLRSFNNMILTVAGTVVYVGDGDIQTKA
jgi:hypothetical protein